GNAATLCVATKLESDPNFCKDEQHPRAAPGRLNRVRSALTQAVKFYKSRRVSVHAAFFAEASGQLPFLGFTLLKPSRGHAIVPLEQRPNPPESTLEVFF
ncbi:MAG: hypothetical protein ACREO9_05290, partial [Lysobacterales bacterium]